MTTAIAPNVAEMMRPKWWNVSAFHSGFSLTAHGQYLLCQRCACLLTRLMLQCIALAFCPSTEVRQRVELRGTCPKVCVHGASSED